MKYKSRRKSVVFPQSATITALWRRYLREHGDADRDLLARHYLEWARYTAARIARRLGIRDWENAVGDALLTMSTRAVPAFNGNGRFEGFAVECMKRTLISALRRQRPPMLSIDERMDEGTLADTLPAPPPSTSCQCRFQAIVAPLDHRVACLLWLRYQRGLSRAAAAATIGMSDEQAHHVLRKSYANLREELEEAAAKRDERPRSAECFENGQAAEFTGH